jgi:hypothetical protein
MNLTLSGARLAAWSNWARMTTNCLKIFVIALSLAGCGLEGAVLQSNNGRRDGGESEDAGQQQTGDAGEGETYDAGLWHPSEDGGEGETYDAGSWHWSEDGGDGERHDAGWWDWPQDGGDGETYDAGSWHWSEDGGDGERHDAGWWDWPQDGGDGETYDGGLPVAGFVLRLDSCVVVEGGTNNPVATGCPPTVTEATQEALVRIRAYSGESGPLTWRIDPLLVRAGPAGETVLSMAHEAWSYGFVTAGTDELLHLVTDHDTGVVSKVLRFIPRGDAAGIAEFVITGESANGSTVQMVISVSALIE